MSKKTKGSVVNDILPEPADICVLKEKYRDTKKDICDGRKIVLKCSRTAVLKAAVQTVDKAPSCEGAFLVS